MKLVVFGLAISSSWGNGHATLWRGLCRALAARGHDVVFFERDVPYYAAHRDMWELQNGSLHLYQSWDEVAGLAARELNGADAGIVTSFCPDAPQAEAAVLEARVGARVFYDLDTAVTLDNLARGEPVAYIGPDRLTGYDVVLSYTGGASLQALRDRLGARRTAALYGSVDPEAHQPVPAEPQYRAGLSYLGTYSADRQEGVERLFIAPARRLRDRRFVLGGSKYPLDFPWTPNIFYMRHVTPEQHPAFYSSSRLTLNVTRRAMAETGYCPSGRLFEAAACGVPILSDSWPGLDQFFEPEHEIIAAASTGDAIGALERSDDELQRIARAARERTLAEHTAAHRAAELERILNESSRPERGPSEDNRVGYHPGSGSWNADTTAGVF